MRLQSIVIFTFHTKARTFSHCNCSTANTYAKIVSANFPEWVNPVRDARKSRREKKFASAISHRISNNTVIPNVLPAGFASGTAMFSMSSSFTSVEKSDTYDG